MTRNKEKSVLLELLNMLDTSPITLQEQSKDVAMVLSAREYAQLQSLRNPCPDIDNVIADINRFSKTVQANGLTPEILAEILADDSED